MTVWAAIAFGVSAAAALASVACLGGAVSALLRIQEECHAMERRGTGCRRSRCGKGCAKASAAEAAGVTFNQE